MKTKTVKAKNVDKKEVVPEGNLSVKTLRVTEKAANSQGQNIYTFDIPKSLNKTEIKKLVFKLYKVKPAKVNVLAIVSKNVPFRGRPSQKGAGRKAMVFLKKGDKIEL